MIPIGQRSGLLPNAGNVGGGSRPEKRFSITRKAGKFFVRSAERPSPDSLSLWQPMSFFTTTNINHN